jgi:hypothetical protein
MFQMARMAEKASGRDRADRQWAGRFQDVGMKWTQGPTAVASTSLLISYII